MTSKESKLVVNAELLPVTDGREKAHRWSKPVRHKANKYSAVRGSGARFIRHAYNLATPRGITLTPQKARRVEKLSDRNRKVPQDLDAYIALLSKVSKSS